MSVPLRGTLIFLWVGECSMAGNDKALILSSTNKDRVDVNPSVSVRNLSAFTWEAWVKPGINATGSGQRLWVERQGGTQKRLRFAATPVKGMLRFEFARADGQADTNYTYPMTWDDYWHFIAFTADLGAAQYQIILDGAMVQTGKLVGCGKDNNNAALPVSDTAAQGVYIGASTVDGTNFTYWDGKVDVIRLWNSVQPLSAMQSRMSDFTTSTADNLLGEWQLEDTGSSIITAVKGTGNTNPWSATLKRNGAPITNLWTSDRPYLGGGELDTTSPTTPTMSAPSATAATSFNLAWSASTDDVYVQNYEVTVSETNDFSTPVAGWSATNVGLARSTQIDGLTPNTNYFARVRALDVNGNGSDYASYNANAAIRTLAVGDILPPTPPTLSYTAVTATTFTLAWAGATDNVGVTGYKIDIATDSAFTQLLPQYRNSDLGNVTTLFVNQGVGELLTYYARVRAYDAAQNESVDSNTLVISTPALPDTTAPDPVLMQPSTSIEAERFTARWNVGVDNVGVTGYFLDVALDEDFTAYLPGYQNRDVGNVLEYNVSPCQPMTSYFARARAYDAAGNVSLNSDYVEVTATLPSTLSGSGILDVAVEPQDATYVSSATPITPKDARERFLPIRTQLSPYESYVRASAGVLGYWRLNGTDNTLVPNLLGTIDGAVTGSPTMRVAGPLTIGDGSYGMHFDGVDDAVSFPDVSLGGDTTIELIVYPRNRTAATIVSTGNAVGVDEVAVKFDASGNVVFTTYNNTAGSTLVGTTPVTLNAWNHVAVVLSGVTGYIYLNGAQVASGAMQTIRSVSRPVTYLGCALNQSAYLADADVTEFVLYDRALSASDVAARRTSITSSTPVTAHQRAVLRFDYSALIGSLSSASLRFFLYDASASTIAVTALTNDVWTASSLTESVLPAQAAGSVSVTSPVAGNFTEVDVTSLLDPTKRTLSLLLDITGTDGVLIGSPADPLGNRPALDIELDVSDAVEAKTLTLTAQSIQITNLHHNPSIEGSLTGVAGTSGATVTLDSDAFHGAQSAKVVTTGSATGQGVILGTGTGLALTGGHAFSGSVWVKAGANDYALGSCFLKVTHTDATTVSGAAVAFNAGTEWSELVLPPVTATFAKTVDKVECFVTHNAATARTFWVDAVILYDRADMTVPTQVPFFDGTATDGFWLGPPNNSQSALKAVELVGESTYVGDANDNATATVQYRRQGDDAWSVHPDAQVVFDRVTKSLDVKLPAVTARWNYFRNQSFELGTGYVVPTNATVASVVDARAVSGTNALQVTPTAASTVAFGSAPNLNLSGGRSLYLSLHGWSDTPQDVTVRGQAITTAGTQTVTAILSLTDTPQRLVLDPLVIASGVTIKSMTLFVDTASATDPFYLDGVQAQDQDGPYLPVGEGDVWWIGNDEQSPTARWLGHDTAYDVLLTFSDADGIVGVESIGESITTPAPPDNALTVLDLMLTPTNDTLTALVTYLGDDNQTAAVTMEWRRADYTTWSLAPFVWDRDAKTVTALITNLVRGTNYAVRATFADTVDPVYGENPIVRMATTTVSGVSASANPYITFGGVPLLDPQNRKVGVTKHDAFSHPDRVTQIEKLPRLDGAVQLSDSWGAHKIKMSGYVKGDDRDDLAAQVASFKRSLARPLQRLVIDTLDDRGYYYVATCTNLSIAEEGGKTYKHVEWDAEFTCADPFRYDAAETVETGITLIDTSTMTITNDGDVQADPVYTITTGNAVTPITVTLTNKTTGARITPQVTILNSDRLVIDAPRLRVTKNGIEVDFAGSFPRLAVGGNQLAVAITPPTGTVGNSTITLTIRRRHRYF